MEHYAGKGVVLTIAKKPTSWNSFFEPFSKRVFVVRIRGNFIIARDQTGMEQAIPIEDEYMKVLNIEESINA